MPSERVTNPDWTTFDSRVIFRADGRWERTIDEFDGGRRSEHRRDALRFEQEGEIVREYEIRNCMTNVDSWFAPDYEAIPTKSVRGEDTFHSDQRGPAERRFDCYPDEIRAGAYQRAGEDGSHEVNVLAGWLHQVANKDFVTSGVRLFYNALRVALDDYEDPPEWALCYDGTPDALASGPFITTLEGAGAYASGVTYEDAVKLESDEIDLSDIEVGDTIHYIPPGEHATEEDMSVGIAHGVSDAGELIVQLPDDPSIKDKVPVDNIEAINPEDHDD